MPAIGCQRCWQNLKRGHVYNALLFAGMVSRSYQPFVPTLPVQVPAPIENVKC